MYKHHLLKIWDLRSGRPRSGYFPVWISQPVWPARSCRTVSQFVRTDGLYASASGRDEKRMCFETVLVKDLQRKSIIVKSQLYRRGGLNQERGSIIVGDYQIDGTLEPPMSSIRHMLRTSTTESKVLSGPYQSCIHTEEWSFMPLVASSHVSFDIVLEAEYWGRRCFEPRLADHRCLVFTVSRDVSSLYLAHGTALKHTKNTSQVHLCILGGILCSILATRMQGACFSLPCTLNVSGNVDTGVAQICSSQLGGSVLRWEGRRWGKGKGIWGLRVVSTPLEYLG